jgi:hypothetical protein
VRKGEEWALAAFSGWMQLGDTHAMLGRMDESIACYGKGFEIQMAALGDRDPRVAETCRSVHRLSIQISLVAIASTYPQVYCQNKNAFFHCF